MAEVREAAEGEAVVAKMAEAEAVVVASPVGRKTLMIQDQRIRIAKKKIKRKIQIKNLKKVK